MKDDFVPSWLEDPTAYAQSTNLDMSTVLLVAGANLVVGIVCVTIFEVLTDTHILSITRLSQFRFIVVVTQRCILPKRNSCQDPLHESFTSKDKNLALRSLG